MKAHEPVMELVTNQEITADELISMIRDWQRLGYQINVLQARLSLTPTIKI